MKNLKRVLSLGLASLMLVGTMVTASAVDGKDFSDKEKIQHNEAVNTLVTLNVINGKEDGSYFDPEGSLTRAEMAKLIVYVLNGGKEPVMSIKATPTYTDIDNHWAEKYIEYCSNLKIIAGRGDGTFDPDGMLTGSQAAKMMLVAMNYDSAVFGFTGNDWELSVNTEANKAGLYDELDALDPTVTINRDAAAQMVYNGLLSNTMKRTWGQNMSNGEISQNYDLVGPTLFNDKFDGIAYEGILTTSGKYQLAGGEGNSDIFTVNLRKIDNVELPATGNNVTTFDTPKTFKYVDQDLTPLMGEHVKVLYDSKKKEVYGVYRVEDMNVVVESTTNALTVKDSYIEIDKVRYDKNGGGFTVYGGSLNDNYADPVKLVDYDADGDLDLAIVTQVGVAQVTFVGTDSITLSVKGGTASLKASNQKTKDLMTYEGIAKDDYVVFHRDMYKNKDALEKAELVEGAISGIGGDNQEKTLIDGSWYKKATNATVYNGGTPVVGDTVKYVALENKIYYMEKVSGAQSVQDLVMVITATASNNVEGVRAKLLFSDGSKKTVTLAPAGADNDNGSVIGASGVGAGLLYSYETTNDGEYKLNLAEANAWKDASGTATSKMGDYTWVVSAANDLGAAGTQIKNVGSHVIADDAVVFAFAGKDANKMNSGNEGKIMTGKELKALTTGSDVATIATTSNGYFHSSVNGLVRATVVAVSLGANATDGFNTLTGISYNNYGYLVSDATYAKENNTSYIVMQLWNGDETIDVKWAKSNAATAYTSYKKHDVIGYDVKAEGEITNVTHLVNDVTPTAGVNNKLTKAAIVGLDGKDISFTGGTQVYKITGDTKILYVNSEASSAGAIGVADGTLYKANKPAGTDVAVNAVYVQNAKYMFKKVGTEYQLEVLVYDVNNRLADRDKTADIVVPNGVTVTINDSETIGTGSNKVKIAAGDVVKITSTSSGQAATITGTKLITNFATGAVTTTVSSGRATTDSNSNVVPATSVAFTLADPTDTLTITLA